MRWISLPSVFREQTIWGAWIGNWQYVMVYDSMSMLWSVSVKLLGHSERSRTDLGVEFKTREEAIAAVEQHYKMGLQ